MTYFSNHAQRRLTTIEDEGYKAAQSGQDELANPHDAIDDYPAWEAWNDGWRAWHGENYNNDFDGEDHL